MSELPTKASSSNLTDISRYSGFATEEVGRATECLLCSCEDPPLIIGRIDGVSYFRSIQEWGEKHAILLVPSDNFLVCRCGHYITFIHLRARCDNLYVQRFLGEYYTKDAICNWCSGSFPVFFKYPCPAQIRAPCHCGEINTVPG